MDGGTIFIYLVLLAFPALIAFAAVYKYMEVAKAARWPKAQGKVVISTTEARRVTGSGGPNVEDTEVRTFAKIVYEFPVAGRKYRGDRVSIGEDLGNFEIAETLAKYPRGKDVTVYYNPRKPTEAVLEREAPPGIWKGAIIIVLVLVGMIAIGGIGLTKLGDVIHPMVRNAGQAPFVTACVGLALLAALVIWGIQRNFARQRAWPTTPGTIEQSGVHEFQQRQERDNAADVWRTAYRAQVIYSYDVAGVRYTGDTAASGVRVSSNMESLARKQAAKYSPGMAVDIHYNPENPAESVLETRGRGMLLLWLIPAAMLTLAYFVGR